MTINQSQPRWAPWERMSFRPEALPSEDRSGERRPEAEPQAPPTVDVPEPRQSSERKPSGVKDMPGRSKERVPDASNKRPKTPRPEQPPEEAERRGPPPRSDRLTSPRDAPEKGGRAGDRSDVRGGNRGTGGDSRGGDRGGGRKDR